MQHWLSVTVSKGQFPGEYAVGGHQYSGKSFSLFAPADAVKAPDGEGQGQVLVEPFERKGDLVLVRLPAQTLENGQYVTVTASELQPATATEIAAP